MSWILRYCPSTIFLIPSSMGVSSYLYLCFNGSLDTVNGAICMRFNRLSFHISCPFHVWRFSFHAVLVTNRTPNGFNSLAYLQWADNQPNVPCHWCFPFFNCPLSNELWLSLCTYTSGSLGLWNICSSCRAEPFSFFTWLTSIVILWYRFFRFFRFEVIQ